jgi:hypothetical protein
MDLIKVLNLMFENKFIHLILLKFERNTRTQNRMPKERHKLDIKNNFSGEFKTPKVAFPKNKNFYFSMVGPG